MLTFEHLLELTRELDSAIAQQRDRERAAGLCVCDVCFYQRMQEAVFGHAFHSEVCPIDPARWWAERRMTRMDGE